MFHEDFTRAVSGGHGMAGEAAISRHTPEGPRVSDEPNVRRALEELAAAHKALEDRVELIAMKTECVTRPAEPMPANANGPADTLARPYCSSVAHAIYDAASHASEIRFRLQSIIDRIDV